MYRVNRIDKTYGSRYREHKTTIANNLSLITAKQFLESEYQTIVDVLHDEYKHNAIENNKATIRYYGMYGTEFVTIIYIEKE